MKKKDKIKKKVIKKNTNSAQDISSELFLSEEWLSSCFSPLLCSNLIAKCDKKSKISQNKSIFRPQESSWTFLEIFNNILRILFEHFMESFG